jgi:hypothetical protein
MVMNLSTNDYDSQVISRMRTVGAGFDGEWDWIEFATLSITMQRELIQVAKRVHGQLCAYAIVQSVREVLADVLHTLGIRQCDA